MRIIDTMLVLSCTLMVTQAAAEAEHWRPSRGAFARFGLVSEVCSNDRDTTMCLALACRAGRPELVSAAGGAGSMEGATKMGFGARSVRATFVEDGRAVDAIGITAARARVSSALLETVAATSRIRLSMLHTGAPQVHEFSTRGLSGELRRTIGLCAARRSRRP